MAITEENFNNTDYAKASGKRIITCSSDKIGTANVFNYRFLLEVVINSITYSYTFRPNNEGYGFINITKILQTHIQDAGDVQQRDTVPELAPSNYSTVQFRQNIHSMPHKISATNPFNNSINEHTKRVNLKLYDFYGDTATAVPTKRTAGFVSGGLYVISGYDKETDLINVDYSDYYLNNFDRKYLNNNYHFDGTRYIINCSSSDWGTISMFRPTAFNNQDARYTVVRYYNYAGINLQNETYLSNTNTLVTDGLITTLGIYPMNLDKTGTTYTPSSFGNNLGYYDVYQSDEIYPDGDELSATYRFKLTHPDGAFVFPWTADCNKYDRQRFAYINDFGVWEYITFTELRRDNISSSPTNIKGSVYNYDGNFEDVASGDIYFREVGYTPNVAHRGEKTVSTNFSETFTVNTGYLSDGDTQKVRDMFLSNKISYINDDGSARAVILENSTINSIKNINKQYEQVSYQLTFRFSVPTYNNIIF